MLGHAILDRLGNCNVIALQRKTSVADNMAEVVDGDMRLPNLGLAPQEYESIASRIDAIIHSAAITDFNKSDEEVFEANVGGTKRMLDLANNAGADFHYISTAFTYEHSHEKCKYDFNNYERSKQAAEAVVNSAGLRASIIRPSIIVGDSQTGNILRYQGMHMLLHLFIMGYMPVVSGNPDSYCDFVPQDFAADAIIALVMGGRTGEDFWITAGERAIRTQSMVDVCVSSAKELTGKELPPVRFLDADIFDRLIRPVFMPSIPDSVGKVIEKALRFSRYMNIERPFPCSSTFFQQELGLKLPPSPEEVLLTNLRCWARKESSQCGRRMETANATGGTAS